VERIGVSPHLFKPGQTGGVRHCITTAVTPPKLGADARRSLKRPSPDEPWLSRYSLQGPGVAKVEILAKLLRRVRVTARTHGGTGSERGDIYASVVGSITGELISCSLLSGSS
jgi:hypothetical protein